MYVGTLSIITESSKRKKGKNTLLGAGIGAVEHGIRGANMGIYTGTAAGGIAGAASGGPAGSIIGSVVGSAIGAGVGTLGGVGYGAYKGYHDGHELYRDIDSRSTTSDKAKAIARYAAKSGFRTATSIGGADLGATGGAKIGSAIGGFPGAMIGAGLGGVAGNYAGYKAGKKVGDIFDSGFRSMRKKKR